MSLRLQQSIRIEQGPAVSQREVSRLVGPAHESPFHYERRALTHRLSLDEDSPAPRPRTSGRGGAAPAQAVLATLEVAARPSAPKWLEGRFRPRNLSFEGQRILERMEPKIVLAEGPVHVLEQAEPWGSLQERMAYLQRKYLLLDMVRKGFAVETDGTFWPAELEREARLWSFRAPARRRAPSFDEPPINVWDASAWVGLFRRASWDQLRALHPGYQLEVDGLLQLMLDQRILEEDRVPFGQGMLTMLGLSTVGLKALKQQEDGRELISRGGGVRGVGPGFGEYHEQAIGDAIGYFTHEVQANEGEVIGITLEKRLRAEYLGAEHIPDLRIEYRTDVGYNHWDIEVLGLGRQYTSGGLVAMKAGSSVSLRCFDPLKRGLSRRDRDVGVGR